MRMKEEELSPFGFPNLEEMRKMMKTLQSFRKIINKLPKQNIPFLLTKRCILTLGKRIREEQRQI